MNNDEYTFDFYKSLNTCEDNELIEKFKKSLDENKKMCIKVLMNMDNKKKKNMLLSILDEKIEMPKKIDIPKVKEKLSFYNSYCIVDVSPSMNKYLDSIIKLAYRINKHKVITFSENPKLVDITSANDIKNLEYTHYLDFEKVLKLFDQDLRKIFIFSDMNFDQLTGNKKNYDEIIKSGPLVICWNVTGNLRYRPNGNLIEVNGYDENFCAQVLRQSNYTIREKFEKLVDI